MNKCSYCGTHLLQADTDADCPKCSLDAAAEALIEAGANQVDINDKTRTLTAHMPDGSKKVSVVP